MATKLLDLLKHLQIKNKDSISNFHYMIFLKSNGIFFYPSTNIYKKIKLRTKTLLRITSTKEEPSSKVPFSRQVSAY